MSNYERKIKNIMKTEHCDRRKAEKFYELSKQLTAEDFTPAVGKRIFEEPGVLRNS